ncbi:electron transporter RnfG [Pseudomonas sp. DTU12.3]|uniref:RnfABCDGE type electron transport complex subunit G n=1 Tax=Pseudomonas sp. DTU12.3 TaxID=2073078 RepID=UPI001011A302|nr:RnfABCDGE type electron transport complex subunit G [Pseudomonas sp. DTU12.3]QAX86654.1 electron transporter RnfG [Pseudomonas sp. DTU12.3]
MNRTANIAIVLVLTIIGVSVTYLLQRANAPQITAEQRRLDNRKLLDVLPAETYDNQPLEQPLSLVDSALAHSQLNGAYRATKAGQPVALLLRSEAQGYAGSFELLIAVDTGGKLIGVKTLRQNETPALGGHLGDWPNAWLQAFTGKSREDPTDNGWALKKDQGQFDQMAGATITSRATINAIHDALRYFDEHRAALLGSGT